MVKELSAQHLIHITLNSGDERISPRSEGRDDIIAMLKPVVAAGDGELAGLYITMEAAHVFTLGWQPDTPAVRCYLAKEPNPTLWKQAEGRASSSCYATAHSGHRIEVSNMNVRYAATLGLLISWYLIYPRTPNQPISQWKIVKKFDSAAGCHAALEDQWARAKEHRKDLQIAQPGIHPEVKKSMLAVTESEANSKCIASDDPRLKRK